MGNALSCSQVAQSGRVNAAGRSIPPEAHWCTRQYRGRDCRRRNGGQPFGPCHPHLPDQRLSERHTSIECVKQRPRDAIEVARANAPDAESRPEWYRHARRGPLAARLRWRTHMCATAMGNRHFQSGVRHVELRRNEQRLGKRRGTPLVTNCSHQTLFPKNKGYRI